MTSGLDSGSGTLRAALSAAADGDVIRFNLPGGQPTINLTSGALAVADDITIDGGSPNAITITRDASGPTAIPSFGVLTIPSSTTLTLVGVQITGGVVAGWQGYGAGIYNAPTGVLTLDNTVVADNWVDVHHSSSLRATAGGVGVYNDGQLTVTRSQVSGNDAVAGYMGWVTPDATVGRGAGLWNAGTLTLRDSTVSGNSITSEPLTSGLIHTFEAAGRVFGIGIASPGNLTVDRSVVDHNFGTTPLTDYDALYEGDGGGVYNTGTATVTDSLVATNQVGSAMALRTLMRGGGLFNAGTLTVARTTITDNRASTGAQYGGGLYNEGSAELTNVTVSGNFARNGTTTALSQGFGDGIANKGQVALRFSTVTNNTSLTIVRPGEGTPTSSTGGGIWGDGVTLDSTIVASNVAAYIDDFPFTPVPTDGREVHGVVTSLGHNLIGVVDLSSGWAATDQTGTGAAPLDPLLGPLQDNGGPAVGPTWEWSWGYAPPTHQVLAGSPALAAGNPVTAPPTDQRGVARNLAAPTVGAFEGAAGDLGGGGPGGPGDPGGPGGPGMSGLFTVAPPDWDDDVGLVGGLIVLD